MSTNNENIDVDKLIVTLMAKGNTQYEVANELKRLGVEPNSLSIIEKKLKAMRKEYRAKTIVELFVKLAKRRIV